ncbi:MAG: response regulator [Bacteroidia bacterium]|nr:response regulator [Bacteroidia bacterium]
MTRFRKISEWRMMGFLLFVVLVVCIVGLMFYNKLSIAANNVSGSVSLETKTSVIIRQISLQTSEAENNVRSYRLTHDNEYLFSFYKQMPEIEARIKELNEKASEGWWERALKDTVVFLTQKRFELLRQQLYLEDEEKITEELNTVSKKIDEAFTAKKDSLMNALPQEETKEKESFFRKLFGRKSKKPDSPDTRPIAETKTVPTTDTSIRSQLKISVNKTKQRQLEKISALKSRDLELNRDSRTAIAKIDSCIAEAEKYEQNQTLQRIDFAKTDVKEIQNLAIVSSGLICVLLLVTGILMLNYVRKKREYENALLEAKNNAEDLAKTKEIFLANMSHEIKTPLNAIHGFTEQVLQNPMDESQRQQLSIVKKSAEYLTKLVTNILNYSRIDAGKLPIEETDFDLKKELEEIEFLLGPEIKKRHIHFSLIVDKKLPVLIQGDLTRFKQIFFNIIGNAIKFTEKGQVNVIVEKPENKNSELRFVVTDTGIGIAAEKIPKLFNEYEQAGSSISRKYGGTGLGLVITKKIIEQLGGNIKLRSIEGQGTEVEIILPFKTAKGQERSITQTESVKNEAGQLRDKSFLIVDDEEFNRLLLRSILLKYGVKLKEATNGAEAIEKTLHEKFDMVIMDIRMPVKNGTEACTEIRRFEKKLPILASTAVISDEKIKRCIEAGFTGFIHKPFSEKKLIETILSVVNDVPLTPEGLNSEPEIKQKRINLEALAHISNGDKNFEKEMIFLFHRSINTGLEEIEIHIGDEEWNKVADTAHKMMAPCKHFDADRLYKYLRFFEELRKTRIDIREVKSKLVILKEEIEAIDIELQLYL